MSLCFNEVQKSLCQRLSAFARTLGIIAAGAVLYTTMGGCAFVVDDPYYYQRPAPRVYYQAPVYVAPRERIIFNQPIRRDVFIIRDGHHHRHHR